SYGLDALVCQCGLPDCEAADHPAPTPNTTVYLITEASTLDHTQAAAAEAAKKDKPGERANRPTATARASRSSRPTARGPRTTRSQRLRSCARDPSVSKHRTSSKPPASSMPKPSPSRRQKPPCSSVPG
ncbi:hypothetical protein ACQI46_25605, partial [Mycobacterium sp. SMC-4]